MVNTVRLLGTTASVPIDENCKDRNSGHKLRAVIRTVQGRKAEAVRLLYVLCLAVGTYTHASMLAHHGWRWDYGGKPFFTVVFWSALTFLDPLVAVLLLVVPRAGTVLLLLLMFSDVVHNTWVVKVYGGVLWMVADQWIFFIFVLATARIIWTNARQQQPTLKALA